MLDILAKDEHSIEFNNLQQGQEQTSNDCTDIFHKNQISKKLGLATDAKLLKKLEGYIISTLRNRLVANSRDWIFRVQEIHYK